MRQQAPLRGCLCERRNGTIFIPPLDGVLCKKGDEVKNGTELFLSCLHGKKSYMTLFGSKILKIYFSKLVLININSQDRNLQIVALDKPILIFFR